MKKISIYKIISIIAFLVLVFILIIPQKFNINRKQKTEECIRNMKTIYEAIDNYMKEREESFTGTTQDLVRTGYLKKSYECPENGVGDKYFMEGNLETGEITVKCPNEEKYPDHVLMESILD
ncbi:MAG: hypothetical protein APR54_02525 [Candidatus Cloacimonas sp. SDB]|nr:MAG: hypothetical protein APR54_02525 [Candidatus Cloacimonas sp. SDB]